MYLNLTRGHIDERKKGYDGWVYGMKNKTFEGGWKRWIYIWCYSGKGRA